MVSSFLEASVAHASRFVNCLGPPPKSILSGRPVTLKFNCQIGRLELERVFLSKSSVCKPGA
jgi:hypothetical protein